MSIVKYQWERLSQPTVGFRIQFGKSIHIEIALFRWRFQWNRQGFYVARTRF